MALARSDLFDGLRQGLLVGAAFLAVAIQPSVGSDVQQAPTEAAADHATKAAEATAIKPDVPDFGDFAPSPEARHFAHWIADSRDNANANFMIVDKKHAMVYVFDARSRLRGASPVLLGSAVGDDAVPGTGGRASEYVPPAERTTPAGRFVAERGDNNRGEDVVWVDYAAAISMHRVLTTKPKERRLERLATSTVEDNRISNGCINVPVAFYEAHVRPSVAARRTVIYVLPDVKSVQQVFGSYDLPPRS